MNDVMIDIETLGVTPKAPVISIGAVFFDKITGDLGERISLTVEFESAMQKRKADASTIAWWMSQSDAARTAVLQGGISTDAALEALYDFMAHPKTNSDTGVWGNGSTFDITILDDLYRDYEMKAPWNHWQVRDCRTVEALSPVKRNIILREGTHHNALDDAIYQAKYISAMIRGMKE